MPRRSYKSDKRRRELDRLKKQEEKRLRRFNKKNQSENPDEASDQTDGDSPLDETAVDAEKDQEAEPKTTE